LNKKWPKIIDFGPFSLKNSPKTAKTGQILLISPFVLLTLAALPAGST